MGLYQPLENHGDCSETTVNLREEIDMKTSVPRHFSTTLKVFRALCATILAVLTFILLLSINIYVTNAAPSSITNCGTSASEALSLHCQYDPMSFAWLPPACYDSELTSEFLQLQDWSWYPDLKSTKAVPLSAVFKGEFDYLYVSWEYHLTHCAYMWKKMASAIESKSPLDGYIADIGHTNHCAEMLTKDRPRNLTNTLIYTKFVDCGGEHHGQGHKAWYRVVDGVKMFEIPKELAHAHLHHG